MSAQTPYPNPQYPNPQPGPQAYYPPPPPGPRPFYRPSSGRALGGVCAAIADYFGWDRTVVRLLTVASVFLPGPQILAYVALWVLVPSEERFWARQAAAAAVPPQYPAPSVG